ncbi:hypothetical protein INT45_002839 [Circinella minor]|uniref:F-box domain-containing protein n=1 Tax=Circinella minor TaxID=1195481 RepID=A0A8H7S0F4_9FUNG|nr:hypothetical protein INT45_002839 [Circinella minor]
MTTTQLETALSLYNPVLGETRLYNTRNAFITKNNSQLVHHATQALTEIQKYQLVSLLDICAYARGMKSKFELAIENAEEIIHYAPEWSIGYLRLGHLLDMQGKSAKSIEVYEEALEIISQQDDPVTYHQLIQLKKAAVERNETRIDFIVMLPPELTSNILLQLSEEDRSTSFHVSTVWRKWMMENGSIVWKELLNSNTEWFNFQRFQTAIKIANTLPYIAQHVKNLTLNGQRKDIWERYMEYMGNGNFKGLKSFTITAVCSRQIRTTNSTMVLLNALWQVKLTLTTLDIRGNIKVDLADLLFYCPNLRKLVYCSFCNFDTYLGEMGILGEPRHKLVHVELESQSFRQGSLVKFLKYFPNIRRLLLLKGCMPENLNEVMEYCHNLESFGYNCAGHKMNRKELDYHQESYYNRPSSAGGITEIFTSETGHGVPTANFLPLLQKNAKSLRRLHANMSMTSEQEAGEPALYVTSVYPSWQFTQLEHLIYHSDIYQATEKVFIQAIEFCTSLKKLNMVDIVNLRMLVDTLIQLPPLEELSLSNITNIVYFQQQ